MQDCKPREFIRLILGAVCLAVITGQPALADELMAGTARVEITPPVGFPMGGYSARKGPSTGVHDPLFARVLLLKTSKLSVAIVSCDLRSFPSQRVCETAKARLGIDHVLICSTHTHSGPVTWENQTWPTPQRSWFADTEDRILRALEEASRSLFQARIAAGRGSIYLGHNRRLIGEDGKVTMLWRNVERKPTGPVDPTVSVMRIDDASGNPRAILVNYACHAVVLGPDNLRISADFPGYMASRIERDIAGATAFFVQGGAGDINPYQDKQPVNEGGFAEAEKVGNALADEALRVARRLKPRLSQNPQLKAVLDVFEFKNRWDKSKMIKADMTTLLINDEIAIVALPGEPFVDFQIRLRDKSELDHTFLFGYCFSGGRDWAGYIPTIKAAAEGGYGADYNTTLEVGAGEAMIDRAVINIYKLLGKLADLPR
jgi:hypothetical protein